VTLTQRVPWTQLLANIVGLSGVLGFFGVLYGQFERRVGGGGGGGRGPPSGAAARGKGAVLQGGALPPEGRDEAVFAVDSPLRARVGLLWPRSSVAQLLGAAAPSSAADLRRFAARAAQRQPFSVLPPALEAREASQVAALAEQLGSMRKQLDAVVAEAAAATAAAEAATAAATAAAATAAAAPAPLPSSAAERYIFEI
jgi:hypothetical protein